MPRAAVDGLRVRVPRSLFGAALVVLVTTGAASAPRIPHGSAPAAPDTTLNQRLRAEGRRPFSHEPHEQLSCRECHGTGSAHRATRIRSSTDCAMCHHDPARALVCTRCHGLDSIPAERQVRLALTLKVSATPRTRDVRFRHAPHLATGTALTCANCHAAPVTMARNRECASCHESHHGGKADCASCHGVAPKGAHKPNAHLSCSSGSCHAAAKAPAPASSRAVCLFCHAGQRNHEPGGTCALCHRIPGAPAGDAEKPLRPAGGPQ